MQHLQLRLVVDVAEAVELPVDRIVELRRSIVVALAILIPVTAGQCSDQLSTCGEIQLYHTEMTQYVNAYHNAILYSICAGTFWIFDEHTTLITNLTCPSSSTKTFPLLY